MRINLHNDLLLHAIRTLPAVLLYAGRLCFSITSFWNASALFCRMQLECQQTTQSTPRSQASPPRSVHPSPTPLIVLSLELNTPLMIPFATYSDQMICISRDLGAYILTVNDDVLRVFEGACTSHLWIPKLQFAYSLTDIHPTLCSPLKRALICARDTKVLTKWAWYEERAR